ncbi:MAG: hypothetical protein IKA02_06660, partial [Clostridia bacterium]|nr:hypothetical protein [Clostridia bacterium]
MVLGNSINLIEEWAKEFREHFGLTGEKISGDQWAELKKIEDSGLYEISNENIGQVNSGYTLSSIFVKNPKSSIIWSALEILLFGDYAKYDVQKDGSYTRELGQNRIKEIYDIFDSIFDAKCGRFTMIVSELYEKLNIDKDTFKNKNVFIDDAVYFLLRVFNRENIRTSNINTHNTIVMNSLRSNGILRDYNYMETIVEELFSKFDGLCEYKNQIDRILNVEVSTNEKVSFFNSKKRVSDYINSCVGFRSNVLNVLDVGFRNCAVSHRFMQAIGDVRSFTNSYFNTSIQYSEDKIELLNFKYSKRDCLEILNKCESINLQSDNKEIESAIEKLKGVARSLDDQIAEINEIVSYFEGETGSAAEKLLEDSRKLKAEFDDAVSNVKLKIGGLSKIIDKKEKEKRLQEINSEKQELEKRLKDLDNELKVMEQECEIISSRDKATLLVEKLDEHITFFKPYIDKTVEYYDEIVAKDIANKIDEVVKKLEEIKANAEIKAKDENLPRFYEEGTESLENGSKNITLKGENGNVKVNLQLLDEDFNELLFSENAPEELTRIRDYSAYHELVDAAVDVKRQPIFNYGDITKYPYFIPFKYQVDSVRTMLARFEVRGVYAEQVGLGKTIQALMTADVVFRCGAIDNVVIVASKTNIPQWRKEAEVKFREANGEQMFEIFPKLTAEEARKTGTTPSKDGFYNFRELNENIEKVKNFKGNSRKKRKLNVFFLSTNSLIDNGSGGIEEIKKSNEYYDLEQMANKPLEPNVKVVANDIINDNLAKPISEEKCIAKLFYMATVLYNRYINNVLPKDLNAFTEVILHGGEIVDDKNIKWDVDKKWEIVLSGATLDKTVDYNNKLEEIRNRIIQIKKDIAEGRKNS